MSINLVFDQQFYYCTLGLEMCTSTPIMLFFEYQKGGETKLFLLYQTNQKRLRRIKAILFQGPPIPPIILSICAFVHINNRFDFNLPSQSQENSLLKIRTKFSFPQFQPQQNGISFVQFSRSQFVLSKLLFFYLRFCTISQALSRYLAKYIQKRENFTNF